MYPGARTGPSGDRADLAIVIVSTNEAHWLEPCLSTVFDHAGGAKLQVIVVDNESTDGTRELVESRFPDARVVSSPIGDLDTATTAAWNRPTRATRCC